MTSANLEPQHRPLSANSPNLSYYASLLNMLLESPHLKCGRLRSIDPLWKFALGKMDSIDQLFSLGEKFSPPWFFREGELSARQISQKLGDEKRPDR